MINQSKEIKKYVISLWQNEFDYDGLTSYFNIIGSYKSLEDAINVIMNASHDEIQKQIKENDSWKIMDVGEKNKIHFQKV